MPTIDFQLLTGGTGSRSGAATPQEANSVLARLPRAVANTSARKRGLAPSPTRCLSPFSLLSHAIAFVLLLASVGCVTDAPFTRVAEAIAKPATAVEMGVIAEPHQVEREGVTSKGVVVQVLLLTPEGKPTIAQGPIAFSLYIDDHRDPKEVEPNERWSFDGDQVVQSQVDAPLGVVHQFWLPLKGNAAAAKKLSLATIYRSPDGSNLTQWNHFSSKPKEIAFDKQEKEAPLTTTRKPAVTRDQIHSNVRSARTK